MFGCNLHPEEDWANAIIDWYYHWLDSDPDFLTQLAELFQALDKLAPRFEQLAEETRHYKTIGYGQPCEPPDPDWPEDTPLLKAIGDYHRVRYEIEQMLLAFAEKWHFPKEHGLLDIWYSYQIYSAVRGIEGEAKCRIISGPRCGSVPTVGIPVEIGSLENEGFHILVVHNLPVIYPNVPLPLVYDPIERGRKWLNEQIDAICAEVRASILQQAEEFERQAKEAGWREKPPRYSPSHFERLALSIYLRAIKCMTWDEIADHINNSLAEAIDADSVRKTTARGAELAGIAL